VALPTRFVNDFFRGTLRRRRRPSSAVQKRNPQIKVGGRGRFLDLDESPPHSGWATVTARLPVHARDFHGDQIGERLILNRSGPCVHFRASLHIGEIVARRKNRATWSRRDRYVRRTRESGAGAPSRMPAQDAMAMTYADLDRPAGSGAGTLPAAITSPRPLATLYRAGGPSGAPLRDLRAVDRGSAPVPDRVEKKGGHAAQDAWEGDDETAHSQNPGRVDQIVQATALVPRSRLRAGISAIRGLVDWTAAERGPARSAPTRGPPTNGGKHHSATTPAIARFTVSGERMKLWVLAVK